MGISDVRSKPLEIKIHSDFALKGMKIRCKGVRLVKQVRACRLICHGYPSFIGASVTRLYSTCSRKYEAGDAAVFTDSPSRLPLRLRTAFSFLLHQPPPLLFGHLIFCLLHYLLILIFECFQTYFIIHIHI